MVTSPAGPRRLVMCCDCNYGPFGHQLEGEPRLWLACDLLHQQAALTLVVNPDPSQQDALTLTLTLVVP